MYKFEIEKKGISLSVELSDKLPNRIIGDELRIRQILINLVNNAIKFTDKGSIVINTYLRDDIPCEKGFSALGVSVTDTGCGIPKEKQEIIFSKFQQSDMSTSRKYGGTGLGLSIVRELLHMMGGNIEVKSEQGKGSEFSFYIIVKKGNDKDEKKVNEKIRDKIISSGKNFNILLAEDNETNIILAVTVLKKLGNRVTVARNGIEALEAVKKDNFDIILMDIEMPEMDGLEAVKRIRNGECGEEKSRVYITAMTAHAIAEIKQKALEAGMNDYVTKPVDITKIQESLDKLFQI
jgi:CheY-like chemotaxis protein